MFARLLIALSILYSINSHATSSEKMYGCESPIAVALYDFGYFYSEKYNQGIDKDLINELANFSNCKFEISIKPRVKIWAEIESGEIQMSVSGIPTDDREKFAAFANYLTLKNVLLFNNIKNIENSKDFLLSDSKLKIGVVRSFKHGKNIDAYIGKLKESDRVVEYPSILEVANAFKQNEVQLMVGASQVYEFVLKKELKYSNYKILNHESDEVIAALILSRKRFSEEQILNWKNLVKNKILGKVINKISLKYKNK